MAVVLVRTFVRALSLRVGAALGRLFYLLHEGRRELAVANLCAAFPSRIHSKCHAILRLTFAHFGRHVVEFLNFDAMSRDQMRSLIEIEGEERVEQAMARGKGVMFCSGHALEHVEDPSGVLRRLKRWLTPGGLLAGMSQ